MLVHDPDVSPGAGVMDFFIDSRALPSLDQPPDDPALDERHWTYMDNFSERMIARGPTLGPDRETWTGSLHVLGLANAEAAFEFVQCEPYNRAGLYTEHLIWRFTNLLGRTMWQFPGRAGEVPYLFVATSEPSSPAALAAPPVADLPRELRERLVLYGLLTGSDSRPDGIALIVAAKTRDAAATLVRTHGTGATVRDWTFGGRR